MLLLFALSGAGLAAAAPAAAAPEAFQSTALLDTIVEQFTGQAIGQLGGARAPVDARLKLMPCAAPQLSWYGEAQDAVVVRCMAPEWKIFVPVNARPKPKPAPAPAPAMVERPAPPPKPEIVIRRGDLVMLEVGADGFSVTRDGVAMGDAVAGGRVAVKVDDKKPPVQAVAIETGRAQLPGWGD